MLLRLIPLLLLGTLCLPAHAEPGQQIRVIPKSYVSPGASGSVSGSASYQQYDLYGGQRLPRARVHEQSRYGSQSWQTRGGIRQSIEYPGGLIIEQQPGRSRYQQQRSR